MAAVFGVHLGSSTASIAICQDGKSEIVANDAGDRTTPAIVACSGKEKSVGIPARQGLIRNAANTICRVKNLVGKEFDDDEVQAYIKKSPCKLVLDKEELKFELDDGNGKKQFITVHEVLVLLYSKTMETANRRCGESDSHDAVIAVPLHFTDSQRSIMRQAASDAGFNVLQVISEPAAALLGYNIGQTPPKEDNYCLVYRMGGSSLDVAVVHISNGLYHVMASERNIDVGGDKMTDLLVSHFIEEFRRQYHLDVRESRRSVAKLVVAAENCKHVLSTMSTAQCFVESLHEGCDFNSNLTRARYESILSSLIPNCMSPIDKVLEEAGLKHSNIAKVVLAGGASKTPKLQQSISDYFASADVMSSVLPDEIIALGAANQAAVTLNHQCADDNVLVPQLLKPIFVKVVENGSSGYCCLLPRRSVIPTHRQQTFHLPNGQNSFRLEVWEGSGEQLDETTPTHLVGKIIMRELPNDSEICASFHARRDGSLHVTCTEKSTSQTEGITIENTS